MNKEKGKRFQKEILLENANLVVETARKHGLLEMECKFLRSEDEIKCVIGNLEISCKCSIKGD